jgi:hypothetical protein
MIERVALKDAIDVAGSTPERVGQIRPVRDQAGAGHRVTERIDRGHLVPGRKRDDQIVMNRPRRSYLERFPFANKGTIPVPPRGQALFSFVPPPCSSEADQGQEGRRSYIGGPHVKQTE